MKKIFIIIAIVLLAVIFYFYKNKEEVQTELKEEETKASVILDVPFTSQAPTNTWNELFNNACEEASLLMVDHYYQKHSFGATFEVEEMLTGMVAWQKENWGGQFDLPIADTAKFAEEYFGYRTEVIEDLTPEKLREFLDKGLPVIIPIDGQAYENPHYQAIGPEYHMLVVVGYFDDKFVTNDPGTIKGEGFIRSEDNIFPAIFDWNKKEGLVLYDD